MGEHEDFNIEGLRNLRAAIVQQACYDYLHFLKYPTDKLEIGQSKNGKMMWETKESTERFFRSKAFTQIFCTVSGRKIMDQLKSNYAHGFRLFSEERIEKLEEQRLRELG